MTGYDAVEDTQFQQSLHIPLDDPAAALSFCRQLAQSLNGYRAGDNLLAKPRLNGSATVVAVPELSVVMPVFIVGLPPCWSCRQAGPKRQAPKLETKSRYGGSYESKDC